jgi:hypothetical protein
MLPRSFAASGRSTVMRAAAALGLSACASAPPADGDAAPLGSAQVLGDRNVDLAAGKFLELNCDVPASAIVAATAPGAFEGHFASDQAIAWNIHEHAGQDVAILGEGPGLTGQLRVVPTHPGPVSLRWKNASEAVAHLALTMGAVPPGTTCSWYP